LSSLREPARVDAVVPTVLNLLRSHDKEWHMPEKKIWTDPVLSRKLRKILFLSFLFFVFTTIAKYFSYKELLRVK